jgi:hypothetical protein
MQEKIVSAVFDPVSPVIGNCGGFRVLVIAYQSFLQSCLLQNASLPVINIPDRQSTVILI